MSKEERRHCPDAAWKPGAPRPSTRAFQARLRMRVYRPRVSALGMRRSFGSLPAGADLRWSASAHRVPSGTGLRRRSVRDLPHLCCLEGIEASPSTVSSRAERSDDPGPSRSDGLSPVGVTLGRTDGSRLKAGMTARRERRMRSVDAYRAPPQTPPKAGDIRRPHKEKPRIAPGLSRCAPGMARSALTGAVPASVVGCRGDLEVEVLYGP